MKSVINTGMLFIAVGLALLAAYGLYSLIENVIHAPSPIAVSFVFIIAGVLLVIFAMVAERKSKKKHGWVID